MVAERLGFQLVTEGRATQLLIEEFGEGLPAQARRPALRSVLGRLATQHPLVLALPHSESIFESALWLLRAGVFSNSSRRLDHFDILLSSEHSSVAQISDVLQAALSARGLVEHSLLAPGIEAQLQFQTRLELARHGVVPRGLANLKRAAFGHPSEETFANLLDFYRIPWQHEPRSFPLQWDKEGNVSEAFTPDFYLPESDLYVELTTMKQSLVTKKNRKVKLLRAVYPHINIQIFYQKDLQDLVFKHGS